jgi:ribose 5-phosphate isomerase A
MVEDAKRAAGERAAALVEDGMRVGLGTGSTTAYALEALGRRIRDEGLRITGTPTSFFAERLARQAGIPLATLDDVDRLDLALDGADEVDPALNLIKGRGAAHTREKVVASQADRFVVLVDASKQVDRLGSKMPLPVEVLPMAVAPVMRALARLGAEPVLRMGQRKDGPVVTDQGFWIVDARFAALDDPHALSRRILDLPGVLDHGLFLDLATDVLVGDADGAVRHLRR